MKRIMIIIGAMVFMPTMAWAQGAACFRVAGEAQRDQHVVGLSTVVRLSTQCEYSETPQGPWSRPGSLAGRDTDFVELLHHVRSGAEDSAGDPRFLFGRPASTGNTRTTEASRRPGATPAMHTLLLRYCVHYLLEEQLGFRVLPRADEEGFEIERLHSSGTDEPCDAQALELRALESDTTPLLHSGSRDAQLTLATGQRTLSLSQGHWSIYAARPEGRVGLRVAVFRARGVQTPLQRHLRSLGLGQRDSDREQEMAPPLLATRWRVEDDGVLLFPTEQARSEPLLWPELRTAADAGLLWLARTDLAGVNQPVVIGDVVLEGGQPEAVRFPDRPAREYMRRRYGPAGEAMVPTLSEWEEIFSGLAICLTPSYLAQTVASTGSPAPEPGLCAALRSLVTLEAPGPTSGGAEPRVCLHRGFQVMGAQGVRWEEQGEPSCVGLPGMSDRMPFHVTVVGDRLSLEHDGGLCVLLDNRPVELRDGFYHLDRSGLLEVRQGGGEGCTAAQGLSWLRLPVIDVEREWHPVGLHTEEEEAVCRDESGEAHGACPWRGLRHDEEEVFAYVRPRQSLEFRLSTSPAVAAAINNAVEGEVQLSQEVPLLSGVEGELEGPRAPGVVAFVSEEPLCPTGEGNSIEELRRRRPIEPDGLIVDRIFHVFLASVEGSDQPPHCLARATFRVRPSRALANATAGRSLGVEFGLLGDIQAVVFVVPEPVALGISLPVIYLRLNLFPIRQMRWLAVELSGNLVFAGAFDPAGVARTGGALSASVQLGIPNVVPRLLSFGIMLHGAFESLPGGRENNPIWGLFVGLDLSTLIDLAGGR